MDLHLVLVLVCGPPAAYVQPYQPYHVMPEDTPPPLF